VVEFLTPQSNVRNSNILEHTLNRREQRRCASVLQCVSLQCVSLYCSVLQCVSLQCVSLQCVSLQCVSFAAKYRSKSNTFEERLWKCKVTYQHIFSYLYTCKSMQFSCIEAFHKWHAVDLFLRCDLS